MPTLRRGYPPDLSDAEWALIEPLLPEPNTDGRRAPGAGPGDRQRDRRCIGSVDHRPGPAGGLSGCPMPAPAVTAEPADPDPVGEDRTEPVGGSVVCAWRVLTIRLAVAAGCPQGDCNPQA